MEQKTITELEDVPRITPVAPALTRRQKLCRWADAVSRSRHLVLGGVEHIERRVLSSLRAERVYADDISVLGIAILDPDLQAAGLKTDRTLSPFVTSSSATVGDVMDFFAISQAELHQIACYCHVDLRPAAVARRIRGVAGLGFLARLAAFFH